MIVAGIGCRRGVTVEEVLGAVSAGLETSRLDGHCLGALATSVEKRHEPGLVEAARRLGLPILSPDAAALFASDARCITDSPVSRQRSGVGSLAEAAALAAAGDESRLAGPRTICGPVTCAIAYSAEETNDKDTQ